MECDSKRKKEREDLSRGTLKGQERTRKKKSACQGKEKVFYERKKKRGGRAGNKFLAVTGGGGELKSLNVLSVKGGREKSFDFDGTARRSTFTETDVSM